MSSAPSTAAPAATDEDASGVRRSGRKRKSTILKIQGHSVLARNNYVLKGGSYVMGAFDPDDQANKKKPKTAAKKPAGAKANNGPRQPKASEIARMQHNEAVKKSILEKQAARRAFLVRQYDILEPFMDEATRRMVASWRPNATIPTPTTQPQQPPPRPNVLVQPDLIQGGELRDYQLAGLNFMVAMHHQNLGMILGDEMGLGKTLQTIALLCYLKERDDDARTNGPSLVVCPLSVLQSWCNELKKWGT